MKLLMLQIESKHERELTKLREEVDAEKESLVEYIETIKATGKRSVRSVMDKLEALESFV